MVICMSFDRISHKGEYSSVVHCRNVLHMSSPGAISNYTGVPYQAVLRILALVRRGAEPPYDKEPLIGVAADTQGAVSVDSGDVLWGAGGLS